MNTFTNIISSKIAAIWIIAIAVLAIQNVEPVSLKFLVWQSIEFPTGVLLAVCAGLGFVGGSLVPLLFKG